MACMQFQFMIKKNLLHLARDFFGKPLYFFYTSNLICFSSTLKPLIKNENIKKKISLNSLDHFFQYGFCPNFESIFQNINKVPPNTLITFDLKKWDIKKKNIHNKELLKKKDDFKLDYNHLDSLLRKSVERRLIADVPVGILLSSGIDSSLVASMLHR